MHLTKQIMQVSHVHWLPRDACLWGQDSLKLLYKAHCIVLTSNLLQGGNTLERLSRSFITCRLQGHSRMGYGSQST